jgi:hypothetical protein
MLLQASQKKIKDFVNLLREKLEEGGCHLAYVNSLSDTEVMDDYRLCCGCGDEIHSTDQQLHVILEFDTPERAFEVLYEEPTIEAMESLEEAWDDIEVPTKESPKAPKAPKDVIIQGRYLFAGSESLMDIISMVDDFKNYLILLHQEGFELSRPVDEDHGHLQHTKK